MTDTSTTANPVRRRSTFRSAIVAVVALVVLVVLMLLLFPADSVWAKVVAIIAGVLVLVKEICSAFARDGGWYKLDKKKLEDGAALCSLFAVVFGVPAVAAAIL